MIVQVAQLNPANVILVTQAVGLVAILMLMFKGGRWTACIERKIDDLANRFDDHRLREHNELNQRLHDLEHLRTREDLP